MPEEQKERPSDRVAIQRKGSSNRPVVTRKAFENVWQHKGYSIASDTPTDDTPPADTGDDAAASTPTGSTRSKGGSQ